MLNIYISTNGCVEGQLSSKQIERFFQMNQATIVRDLKKANLIIFYACGLTEEKEKNSLSIIRKLQAEMNPSAKLIIWGCLPKIKPQSLTPIYDGPLIGPLDGKFFEEIPEKLTTPLSLVYPAAAANELFCDESSRIYENNHIDPITIAIILLKQSWEKLRTCMQKDKEIFFIPIATGCNGHCTYCSERPVFGKVKSRPIDDIIADFKKGLEQGYNRFSLIATDLGSYGQDLNIDISHLLEKMIETNEQTNYKITLNQFGPLHLKELYTEMRNIFASGKIEKVECPVQSGSNRILELMGREYTAEDWREQMLRLNKEFPNIRLSTQFMVGFPTETPDDFNATMRLMDRPLVLDSIYIFKFSKRPSVAASRTQGQISEKTKELRYKKLLQKYAYRCVVHMK
jgi:tRNA A37 methylthiotransferase MiaB